MIPNLPIAVRRSGRGWPLTAVLAVIAGAAVASAPRQTQTPTFRAAVDLVAVDVQIVDRDGRPIPDLAAGQFSVTIDGRDRRVVSADHIQYAAAEGGGAAAPIQVGPAARNEWPASGPAARTFLLAIDADSFNVGEGRRAAEAARAFVDRLLPNDLVGVFAYPLGPHVAPTADRTLVRTGLDSVVGGSRAASSQFHLTAAEVVDINAELAAFSLRQTAFSQAGPRGNQLAPVLAGSPTETLRRVQIRECGNDSDIQCAENIEREATILAFYYEVEITRAINDLGALIRTLGDFPGRKTVVVLSAGMPIADRPGGRPTVADLARVLGEEAARSNASIYAIHLDSSFFQAFSAETRSSRSAPSQARESAVMGRFLDQFASASGGTMFRSVVGSGETALGQILRETSAYYLLGVAPAEADRDGRTHKLRVRVDARGATIRSRTWVHIPKRPVG